jgi:ABC-type lipopolysaccharide export system ATPase subunit
VCCWWSSTCASALGIATHGVVMEGGRVRLRGLAQDVVSHPEIAALYLGGATRSATPAAAPTGSARS